MIEWCLSKHARPLEPSDQVAAVNTQGADLREAAPDTAEKLDSVHLR
jgi:hypothetical protein